ncbi:hypothetical protein BJ322DRAFT_1018341 [Thelephora terrestris]|uniref:Uncharacterized protein n=1 Tax=Thelephora terrestris TaxID=56493 RepID=A0A9P6HL65_9AGAM|nr:hypothetical protein BJ322DRAFT_1018341 [Thelephora terrestris]
MVSLTLCKWMSVAVVLASLFVTLGARKRSLLLTAASRPIQVSSPTALHGRPTKHRSGAVMKTVCAAPGVGRDDGNNSTRWKNREQKWFVTMCPHSILRLYKLRKQQSSDRPEPDPPDPSIEVRIDPVFEA